MNVQVLIVLGLSMVNMQTTEGFVMQGLQKRTLAASGLPDPHCKTGVLSLPSDGKPQSCCAGYCGACNDYDTCKSIRGQASENACCASKVYEMRCGNAPANVCLKTCSEAVPPCIMDKDVDSMDVKVKTYKGVPPCNEIIPVNRELQANAVTKGELLADLHASSMNFQRAGDTEKAIETKLEEGVKAADLPKDISKEYDEAIKHAEKDMEGIPKHIDKVRELQEAVEEIKFDKDIPRELTLKVEGEMGESNKNLREAEGLKKELANLNEEVADDKADDAKKEDDKPVQFESEYTIAAVSKTARGPYLSHNGDSAVDLWKEAGVNQKWKIVDQGGSGEYTIAAVSKTERGPYVSHDTTKTVDLWKEAGANQKWNIVNQGDDEYTIAAVADTARGPYLSHDGEKTVDLWKEAGVNQKWSIPGLLPSAIVISTIEAVSETKRGPYVSHNGASTVDLWKEAGVNQKWKFVNQGGHEYTITAVSETTRGPYISHNGDATVDLWTQAGPNQKWSIVNQGGNEYTIAAVSKTNRGPYLSHNGDSTVDLWKEAGVNQKWRIPGLQK